MKAIITPGMLFEALGFRYFGPVNGHNVGQLVTMLQGIREMKGPILLHTITQKGKGYGPAERDKQFLHAIGKVDNPVVPPKVEYALDAVASVDDEAIDGEWMLEGTYDVLGRAVDASAQGLTLRVERNGTQVRTVTMFR